MNNLTLDALLRRPAVVLAAALPVVLGLQLAAVWVVSHAARPDAVTAPAGPVPAVPVEAQAVPPLPLPLPEQAATAVEPEDNDAAAVALLPEAEPEPPPVESVAAEEAATPPPAAPDPVTPPARPLLYESAWVLTRDPGRYTLQILSGTDHGGIGRMARHQALPTPRAFYSTRQQGRRWYALIAGEYASEAEARAAAAALTSSQPRFRPWVRRFGDIQSLVQ
ncbi:MAG: SPOR domain-containing protein [Pseudomonadota bacterium]|nr:SPOR domain-containing protein [Pseudomonadota bacterium]